MQSLLLISGDPDDTSNALHRAAQAAQAAFAKQSKTLAWTLKACLLSWVRGLTWLPVDASSVQSCPVRCCG